MNKNISFKIIVATLISYLGCQRCFAQTSNSSIKVIAQSFGDSVIIRWAPTKASDWKLLNNYGYKIERYTIIRDSLLLEPKPIKQLNSEAVKPTAFTTWAILNHTDQPSLVAAQAIYGKSFEIGAGKSTSVIDIVNKSKELELRYSMTLFSCDISSLAARLSGLRWVDNEVKKNEKYLYRVYSLVPETISKIDFGFAYVSPKETTKFSQPRSPEVHAKGFAVSIDFDTGPLNDIYSAFQFEKSDDAKTYEVINKSLMVAPHEEGKPQNLIHLVDTLTSLQPKYYRVRGLTPFGIWGPYSEPTKVIAQINTTVHAVIEQGIISPLNTVSIAWKFPQQEEIRIDGFDIENSSSPSGSYKTIAKMLTPSTRSFEDVHPKPTNYYRIVSIDKSGARTNSFPILVQLVDSIPPAAPANLISKIDSVGKVEIGWAKNKESDFSGYHVYRSNFKGAEFSRVTKSILRDPIFRDTIDLHNLSNKIYYKVAAFDKRNNQSPYSPILIVVKPDINPPVPPSVYSIEKINDTINIKWHSVSADVKSNLIYRKENSKTSWVQIATTTAGEIRYKDSPGKDGVYRYKIIAEDSSGNKSSSSEVEVSFIKSKKFDAVKLNNPKADREKKQIELSWQYRSSSVPQKFQIFRTAGESPYSLYKTISGESTSWIDTQLSISTRYRYRVVAVFKDGNMSPFGNEVIIDF